MLPTRGRAVESHVRKEGANLFFHLVKVLEDGFVRLVRSGRCLASGSVVSEAVAQELGAKVVGVGKGLMLALEHITASHEDLDGGGGGGGPQLLLSTRVSIDGHRGEGLHVTRSKAVEQARGCVATKTGGCTMASCL